MAKTTVLVPRKNMADHVMRLAPEYGIDLHRVKVIDTSAAVEEAHRAIEEGANIIVARGLQALLIMEKTSIPVVEIRLTGQELGLLIHKAKQIAGSPRPAVAIVGFRNMFSSMHYFDQLFGISLRVYYAEAMDDLRQCVERALEEGAEVVIGGEVALMEANRAGIPALFYEATEESLREALSVARKAAYAADMEKRFQAQTETILDVTPGGILKTDRNGIITMGNRIIAELLETTVDALVGRPLQEVLPLLEPTMLYNILSGQQERLTVSVLLRGNQMMLAAAPILVGGEIDGGVFTFHRLISMSRGETASLRERLLHGYVARAGFEQVLRNTPAMRKQIELARSYALSKSAVILYGESGTEKELFAQAIHNNSARHDQPYVSIRCYSGDPQAQYEALFGVPQGDNTEKGAFLTANFGTVVLHDVELLSDRCQQNLLQMLQTNLLIRGNIDRAATMDIRIILTSTVDLAREVACGNFRAELYYALGALVLEIPPLRRDTASIRTLAQRYISQYMEQYAKYIQLDSSAWQELERYEWKGNLLQLESFCERLVAGADKRRATAGSISSLLMELYPEIQGQKGERAVVIKHPEAVRLARLMEKHGGSRKDVAQELGISTTTLWRRINKYGIASKYEDL